METTDSFTTSFRNLVKDAVREVLAEKKPQPDQVMEDKITREDAIEILDTSVPTLIKWENEGKVKRYGTPRKPYYFRSELMEVVRNMHHAKTPKL